MSVATYSTTYRDLFSLPSGVHYFNCAYMAPLSRAVETAGTSAVIRQRFPSDIPPDDYFAVPNVLRQAFARLIHANDPRRIAVVSSVSYAMETAVRNTPLARDQNVVVIGDEFPSAILPWRRHVGACGAMLRTVERCPNWNDALYEAIDRNTAAVVLSNVHWSDGTLFDLVQLSARARDVGAAVIVDGTQSVGALPFDVTTVQPDLLVCAGYKWLTGAYGLSVAYVGARFDNGTPLEQVWTGQAGSEDFARLAEYRDAYRPYADRYDGGQRASFVLAPMLTAAIEQLLAWDPARIQRHCSALLEPWLGSLASLGVTVNTSQARGTHLFGLRFSPGTDVHAVAHQLYNAGVHVSVRGDAIRVSLHLYNDEADVAALVDALK
jgi:selenocysteine lyase/cysteine desulfurase